MITLESITFIDEDQLRDAIVSICAVLDGQEWSADTAPAIADVLAGIGIFMREPGDDDEGEGGLTYDNEQA